MASGIETTGPVRRQLDGTRLATDATDNLSRHLEMSSGIPGFYTSWTFFLVGPSEAQSGRTIL
jgi:hypothetical protein